MPLKKKAKIKSKSPLSKLGSKTPKATSAAPSGAGWMTTGNEAIREEVEAQRIANSRKRPPEFWLQENETKTIRLVASNPLGKIMQYTFKLNGKWVKFTAPGINPKTGQMEPDLFMQSGLNPSSKVIYEIVDRTGYKTKDGKTVKNVPRFWVVGAKLYENMEKLKAKFNDLRTFDIEVSRTGTGTSTAYTLIPEPASPFDFGKIESIADSVAEFYAPPSVEEQQMVLSMLKKMPKDD